MKETKAHLRKLIRCSLEAALTTSGEISAYFSKQAIKQQERLDELVRAKKPNKSKKSKRSN